jgi:TPR repeat protein
MDKRWVYTVRFTLSHAMLYLTVTCNLNDAVGCRYLGKMYAEAGNTEKALSFYRKACNLGNTKSCKLLSNFHQQYPN